MLVDMGNRRFAADPSGQNLQLSFDLFILLRALNGNVGVIKSMMVEITDSTNLAQAHHVIPS